MKNINTLLYFITDSTGMDENDFLEKIESALKGGVTLLQLREKEKSTREYVDLAKKVKKITSRYNVPLIIDDRLDVALASCADGVHLGQSDMRVADARKIVGENFIIGATAKTPSQAIIACEEGADYLGVGAIFPTTTKVKTVITSVDTLKEICNNVPVPINAIGGLNKDNINVLNGSGISGICVVSAIMKSENPELEAKKLKEKTIQLLGGVI